MEKITATDGDSAATPNGQIRYRLESGGQDKFIINDVTGQVVIAPGATFDATAQSVYTMQVSQSFLLSGRSRRLEEKGPVFKSMLLSEFNI